MGRGGKRRGESGKVSSSVKRRVGLALIRQLFRGVFFDWPLRGR